MVKCRIGLKPTLIKVISTEWKTQNKQTGKKLIIIKLIQVFVTKPEQISVLANHLPSLAYTVAYTPQMPMNRELQDKSDGV